MCNSLNAVAGDKVQLWRQNSSQLYHIIWQATMAIATIALAVSISTQARAEQPGSSAASKANHCVGCHDIEGYRSVFPDVYPVPKIGGQNAAYIERALRAYRDNTRIHPSMNGIAAQLSDEDIKILSEWYANKTHE